MTGKLAGKKALVTGGSSGIGLATAKLFLEEGAQVAITGKNPQKLQDAATALGGDVHVINTNAGKLSEIQSMATEVKDKFGNVDVLFVNAGIGGTFKPLEEYNESDFDELFNINFKGAFFTVQAISKLMNKGGSIVFNTSVASSSGFPGTTIYSATKAALRSLARTAGAELISRGIRVNAVAPGPIDTDVMSRNGPAGGGKEVVEGFAQLTAMKRVGSVEEVSRAVLFLASDDSSYVLGHELLVDGGLAAL